MASAIEETKQLEAMERRLASLENETADNWLRGGDTGGLFSNIDTVDEFPPIPTTEEGARFIHYQKEDESETDQAWYAAPGHTVWVPVTLLTQKIGTPGTSP